MSGTEKVFGAVKAIMLMQERFDGIDQKILRQEDDLTALSRSHAELAQRVSSIEGAEVTKRSHKACCQGTDQ
jgi:predicted methyltransferase